MKDVIKRIKGFKIVPDMFRSSTIFDVKEFLDDDFEVELFQTSELNLDDYKTGDEVEVFGLGEDGLVYFVTTITDKNDKLIKLKYPTDLKNIQRREYSRVKFDGPVQLKDFPDATVKPDDISAGGLKFDIDKELSVDKTYEVTFELKNNVKITCDLEILKIIAKQEGIYDIRARFLNLKSVDRIALIQYSFQVLLENENK